MIPSSDDGFNNLLARLKADFPEFRFKTGKKFSFRAPKAITIGLEEPKGLLLLHEVGHALLDHRFFGTDIERIKMEVAAWEKAKELAPKYGVNVDETVVQGELDTYRDWLHKKSRCPKCGLTRFQTPDGVYHCPACN